MKTKMIPLIFILCPFVSMAGDLPDIKIQMLDSEIARLTHERDEKYAALQECAKSVKGFKIAGITTLIATGIGVYGNIELAKKLKNKSGGGGGKSARVIDNRPQGEKKNETCELLCLSETSRSDALKIGCPC